MSWKGAISALVRDERLLLLGIGLAAYSIANTMFAALKTLRENSKVQTAESKTQYITQDTEDSLQVDTLTKLFEHPGFLIRDVATKILCDRAINDPVTLAHLLFGITLDDHDEREYCLRALSLMTSHTLHLNGYSKLNTPEAYHALVLSLERGLDDAELPVITNPRWDEYHLRDTAERFCLQFIYELTAKYGANRLVKAKFIEKWLVKQAWGSEVNERQENLKMYISTRSNKIVSIINRVMHCKRGLRALEKAGLLDQDSSKRQMDLLPEGMSQIGSATDEAPPTDTQLRRAREQSVEERRLRRQHREAMVLNDGTRPLAREDIIERDHGSPT